MKMRADRGRDGEKQQIVQMRPTVGGGVCVCWRTERVARRKIKMVECDLINISIFLSANLEFGLCSI